MAMVLAILWVCVGNMHSHVMVWPLGAKLKLGCSHRQNGDTHQRYKGVPVDVSKMSRLCHERIVIVLFSVHLYTSTEQWVCHQ
jgi:hypothetical protein